jgi:hypothetical protein
VSPGTFSSFCLFAQDPENEEEEIVELIKFDGFCVRTYEEDKEYEEEEDIMAG